MAEIAQPGGSPARASSASQARRAPSASRPEQASQGRQATWRDGKRYLWLLGLVVPAYPFTAWGLVELTGSGFFWWSALLIVFGLVPLLDLLVGKDSNNPPDSVLAWLEGDRYYRWCTYLYLPLQYAGLVLACWLWTTGGLSAADRAGLTVTVGVVAGLGINTAHELGHKKESLERWLARIALAQTFYGHFYIEHNRGHHVRVATPEDPASSRLGQTFWAFLPRSVFGSLRSGWHLETARLARRGKGPWTPQNDVLNAWAMSAALFGALAVAFGPGVLPYLAVQAVIGFCLLEVVNYLEHYGLLRQKGATGRYERCTPRHSWNSDDIASNVFLYHLQRHSDHHANPTRRYQALRHFEESPQLPSGYAGMILLALVPPLWRRVMDPLVLAHYGGDVARANIQPRRRARVLARYGGGAA
ncbi:alkane 1-monooxygenase [Streptomyces sp. NPDC059506]|uniref:alkane 1-monooxygenase n=1 Tax=Streptomyces sp. NPDC059506 TaxID=3347751 RepID=UPI0036D03015